MLQHKKSIEKISRLHSEATHARLVQQTKSYSFRKVLAKSLTRIASYIDGDLEIQIERKVTA